jgi:GAF domain-containing protein
MFEASLPRISAARSLDDLVHRVVTAVQGVFSGVLVQVTLYDERATQQTWTFHGDQHTYQRLPQHVSTSPIDEIAQRDAVIDVPMRVHEKIVGRLCLQTNVADPFHTLDHAQLQVLADVAAASVENITLLGTMLRRVHEAGVLNEISRVLAHHADYDELWSLLYQQMLLLFDTASFVVGVYDNDTRHLHFPLMTHDGTRLYSEQPHPLTGLNQVIITHGIPLQFRDLVEESERLAALGVTHIETIYETVSARSWLGVPLQSR